MASQYTVRALIEFIENTKLWQNKHIFIDVYKSEWQFVKTLAANQRNRNG